jgi:hypothetical protein
MKDQGIVHQQVGGIDQSSCSTVYSANEYRQFKFISRDTESAQKFEKVSIGSSYEKDLSKRCENARRTHFRIHQVCTNSPSNTIWRYTTTVQLCSTRQIGHTLYTERA